MGDTNHRGTRGGVVAITGSTGQVGRALQRRLEASPNRVVALDRSSDLAAAVAGAEVLVHLAGTLQPRRPNTYEAANLETVRATARAVRDTDVQRIVFLSFLTAAPRSTNPYLRSKAEAETLLVATGVPTVVFRTGHIYGPPRSPGPTAASFLARDGRVSILGPGSQRITPIYLDDVVEAIVRAALEPATPTGTFPLTGPETFTVDEFARRLNGGDVQLRHLSPLTARVLGRLVPSLPGPLVDVMLRDTVDPGDATDTAMTFGLHRHQLAEVWAEPASRAREGPR